MDTLFIIDRLPLSVTEQQLRKLFEPFGEIRSARVMRDWHGLSLAFGYVEMMPSEAAAGARKDLDGKELNGQAIRVAGPFTARCRAAVPVTST
jgi:cold-inducible RNA-binding protein